MVLTCLLVAFSLNVIWAYAAQTRLPPSPCQLPLIGNIHQLPAEYQHTTIARWGREFGELVHARFFSTPILVLNHTHTARALLEQRGDKYSSRPRFTFHEDIVQWDHVVKMPYSDRWRCQRRWLQTALLTRRTLDTYKPLQHREVHVLLRDIARDPPEVLAHIRRYTAAVVFGIAYGYSPSSLDDEHIRRTEGFIKLVLEGGGPGSMLVDFLPILKYLPAWLPGMDFKRRGLRARGLIRHMEQIPLRIEEGTARCSTATALLEEAAEKGVLDAAVEKDIEIALAILYIAGIDTTSSTLSTFVLLMMLHHDVQRKVQEELDTVVGYTRLPTLEDRATLPYLEAVFTEVYRYTHVASRTPLMLTEDDVYAGYNLSEGTVVVVNIWAMSRDEKRFPDPDRFDPERFMDSSLSAEAKEARDPRKFVFGFGRRLCPGRMLADSSIFLAAANLLAAFDIRPAQENGTLDLLSPSSFTSGIVRHPKPFQCRVVPRSETKAELIHAAREEGQDDT
ncbi:hypothetical protein FOMPIDRAFT_48762 [Fomitopsis schrenkii]|uniref:Cytochrome P450 n=1 Tax=Fomitopsis schrenkii TaxID=2126942 RepID=S8EWE7_FOMSC|nr:hypothetical protein FOMPIDRAFT_48762 [Fomitopsis schrenkii]